MKKSCNRALSALLAVLMIVSLLVVPAGAAPVFLESEGTAEVPVDLPSIHEETAPFAGSVQAELSAADDADAGIAPQADGTHTIDKASLTASADKEALGTVAGEVDEYFTLTGSVVKRWASDKGVTSFETSKQADGAIGFTVVGTATVTVNWCSTSGSNTSAIALQKEDGTAVKPTTEGGATVDANNHAIFTGTGAGATTVWELEAGSYKIVSPANITLPEGATPGNTTGGGSATSPSDPNDRGVRLLKIDVEEVSGGGAAVTTEYKIDKANLTASADKEALGTVAGEVDEYFTLTGSVVKRWASDKGVTSFETSKQADGAIGFTVVGTATVTVNWCSTSGSNTSAIALQKEDGTAVKPTTEGGATVDANNHAIFTGTGAGATTVWELEAGSYKIVSPANITLPEGATPGNTTGGGSATSPSDPNDRGVRLLSISVKQTSGGGASVTTEYKIDKANLTASADKEALGTVAGEVDEYFTLTGSVVKRWASDKGVTSFETSKQADGAIGFTVVGTATVTVNWCSTSGSNTSAIALQKEDGTAVKPTTEGGATVDANNHAIFTGTGAGATTVWELEAGSYKIVSPANITLPEGATPGNTTGGGSATSPSDPNDRGVRLLTITVSQTTGGGGSVERKPATWDKATIAPSASMTKVLEDDGDVVVTLDGVTTGTKTVTEGDKTIIYKYAEGVKIVMGDEQGNALDIKANIAGNKYTFKPTASGKYTLKGYATRSQETDLLVAEEAAFDYVLPLAKPYVNTNSEGGGVIALSWVAVPEATGYNVYQGDTKLTATPITALKYQVTGLTVGTEYTFKVEALRGSESVMSDPATETATAEKLTDWRFATFGTSTSYKLNSYTETTDANGKLEKVQIASTLGAGKLTDSTDGIAFYYTPIPTSQNFTLRAKVHVDSWSNSSAQNSFGVAALDHVDEDRNADYSGNNAFWTNSVLVGSAKVNYKWDNIKQVAYGKRGKTPQDWPGATGVSYEMRLGLASRVKTGITEDFIKSGESNPPDSFMVEFQPLEKYATQDIAGKYNIVSNYTYNSGKLTYEQGRQDPTAKADMDAADGTIQFGANKDQNGLTDFILEIERNPTGFFMSYYEAEGFVPGVSKPYQMVKYTADDFPDGTDISNISDATRKFYDPDVLSVVDPDYIYVGMYTARTMTATFSDIELTTVDVDEDTRAVEPHPITKITPSITIASPAVSNKEDYTLSVVANVKGTVKLTVNGQILDATAADGTQLENGEMHLDTNVREDFTIKIKPGRTRVTATFQPDADQGWDPAEYLALANTNLCQAEKNVDYEIKYANRINLYVSPRGKFSGAGSRKSPLDLDTAVKVVQAGQTIVLMEGEYVRNTPIRIERGMDGTAEKPIRMIADPEAETRPVLNFNELSAGITHAGDYWYFKGFDVTNTMGKQKGFTVCGHNNVLDQIVAHHNGDTGIQISTLTSSTDKPWDPANPTNIEGVDWPCNNLILNCTSYANMDPGDSDADGFAAKLQVGVGNIFDGCVSYNNADDGWDLYSKAEWGQIGAVTLQNCITYDNGYHEDGSEAGNGNGFKMGGEGLVGGHKLINSVTFGNLAKGIDCNSCPDIHVTDSTTYNNESYNVALYTKGTAKTAFTASGVVSFKDETIRNKDEVEIVSGKKPLEINEQIKPVGQATASDYDNTNNYYWENGKSSKKGQADLTTADFKSLTFQGWERDPETGAPKLKGDFLALADATKGGADLTKAVQETVPAAMTAPLVEDPADKEVIGSGGATASGDNPGVIVNGAEGKTETVTNPDGSKTTTTTDKDGNKTVVTEAADGSKTEIVSKADGEKSITVTDASGEETVSVKVPAEVPAPETPFTDVPEDHWAKEAIDTIAGLGLVKGVDDVNHVYDMTSNITRGALANVLYRFSNGKAGLESSFSDVLAGAWYTDGVAWAAKVGVVNGYDDGTFGPDNAITRQELAIMLYRYAKLIGMDVSTKAELTRFNDSESVASWAKEAMTWCAEAGIVKGVGGNTLNPEGVASRAECAVMLSRFIDLV